MIDLDEDSINWQKKYPEVWERTLKEVKEKQKEEVLLEAKKLGKKELSLEELCAWQKKKLDSLILEKKEYILKKKLNLFSPEVRGALQENLTGLSIPEAAEQIEILMELYYKLHPAEPIGQSEKKNDWPEKIDEAARKADLDQQFKEAMS